jgi:hypothetical protein
VPAGITLGEFNIEISVRSRSPVGTAAAELEAELQASLNDAAWGIDSSVSDRLLGVVEGGCTTQVNGAEWRARAFHQMDDETQQPLDRRDALREMRRRSVELVHSNEPGHTWPLT